MIVPPWKCWYCYLKNKNKNVFNIFQLHFDPNEFTGKKKIQVTVLLSK